MADKSLGAYNIFDLREQALSRVPKDLFEFVDRGTEDEVSLRNNRAVFERIRFKPRTLVDVSRRTQEITLFEQKQKMPICIAPTGTAGLMWHEGEIALARAYENYPSEIKYKVTAAPMGRSQMKNDSFNWEDLKVLRRLWPGTFIVKGLAHPQDAVLAADCGADGVVVSNHGGRNLDGSMAPLEALPEVVDAVGHRIEVMVDGGFRRGSDVVKALALGAKAVLIGRATLYGVAAGGEAGAARAIDLFREEIRRVLALLGARSVAELGPELLHFTDGTFRRPPTVRADLKLLDTARAAAEG